MTSRPRLLQVYVFWYLNHYPNKLKYGSELIQVQNSTYVLDYYKLPTDQLTNCGHERVFHCRGF